MTNFNGLSRSTLALLVASSLSFGLFGASVIADPSTARVLMVSSSEFRKSQQALSNATVKDRVAIRIGGPVDEVANVKFFLDDPSARTDSPDAQEDMEAPFEFEAADEAGLDTTKLVDGQHSLLAIVTTKDAKVHDLYARFSVSNSPTTKRTVNLSQAARIDPISSTTTSTTSQLAAKQASDHVDADFELTDRERQMIRLINDLRKQIGVQPLVPDRALTENARDWAGTQARKGDIWHQNLRMPMIDIGARAENVAYNQNVQKMHDAYVKSPGHYVNMVNPDYDRIGVGFAPGNDGRLFNAEEFGTAQ